MIEFKKLEPNEVEKVLPLAREFAAQIDHPVVRLDDQVFARNWRTYVEMDVGVVIAALDGDTPAGALVGYVIPDHRNGELIAEEAWWFVSPPYRKVGVGRALIELFERHARSRGVRRVSLGTIGHLEPVGRLLTNMGYEPFETTHFKFLS